MDDRQFAQLLAVSLHNAGISDGSKIAMIADGVSGKADDPDAFKGLVAAHFGLDLFDELFWKSPYDYKDEPYSHPTTIIATTKGGIRWP